MSRASAGEFVTVRATNNIYTALAAVGTIAVGLGLVALFIRATALGVKFF